MAKLSISRAWDETKGDMAREGRLFASIAVALIGLPTAASTLISPEGMAADSSKPLWVELMGLAFALVALIGQLALVRLALKPPATVGEALAVGAKRLPAYFGAALMFALALVAVAIPIILVAMAMGVRLDTGMTQITGVEWMLAVLLLLVALALAVRLLVMAPVAVAEGLGPISILKRSWAITSGHWVELFGFLIAFLFAAFVLLAAVGLLVASLANLVLGPVEPLSASALLIGIVQGAFNAGFSIVFAVMLAQIYVQLAGRDTVASN